MSLSLTDIKKYLRIDYDYDDNFLLELKEVAILDIYIQTDKQYNPNAWYAPIYELAINLTIAGHYDKRIPFTEKIISENANDQATLKHLINTLSMIKDE